MILELDYGNSSLKWRMVDPATCAVHLRGRVHDVGELLASVRAYGIQADRCRLVSVRTAAETGALVEGLMSELAAPAEVAVSTPELAGVKNGYQEFSKLGVDRWLAVVAAYRRCSGACAVIDVGTAVTVDYVRSDGQHVGGYIAPGLNLLRRALLQNTRGVIFDVDAGSMFPESTGPGRATDGAVEMGCRGMIKAFIDHHVFAAAGPLGADVKVYVTGGDSGLVTRDRGSVEVVDDLVFEGLAIACP